MDSRIRCVADGFRFLEAPRWHDGALYFSDFNSHVVLRCDAEDRITTVAEVEQRPSGLGFLSDGRMLVVSMLDRRVLVQDAAGTLSVYADLARLIGGPANDLIVDAAGRAYVGNFGSDTEGGEPEALTVLLRIDPDGTIAEAADDVSFPNGMAFTADRRTLLVAESLRSRITAFAYDPATGLLGDRRVWAQFTPEPAEMTFDAAFSSGGIVPDGIDIDADDHVWVANAAGHTVPLFAEGGEILDELDLGDRSAYACGLGGADGRTLYLCVGPAFGTYDRDTAMAGELWAAQL